MTDVAGTACVQSATTHLAIDRYDLPACLRVGHASRQSSWRGQAHGCPIETTVANWRLFNVMAGLGRHKAGHDGRAACDSHQEHALAVRLVVEQLVGFLRLLQLPAVREQRIHVDLAFDAERRALGLDDVGEGPGGDQRHLPT